MSKYEVCLHVKRNRWYPHRFPFSTVHVHFGTYDQPASWEEAHMVWTAVCADRSTVQAVLSRDDQPIRFYHRDVGHKVIGT